MDEKTYEVYIQERQALVEGEKMQSHLFDKAILTLGAGALGLSITFITKIAPKPKLGICLILSWGFLTLSILSTLLSFLLSQKAHRKQREVLKSELLCDKEMKNPFAIWVARFNIFSIAFFISGIIFLVLFGSFNILSDKEIEMNKKGRRETKLIEDGQVPQEAPESFGQVPQEAPESLSTIKKGLVPTETPQKPEGGSSGGSESGPGGKD